MSECKCTIAQSLTGDGCRYCQPQEYINRLHEQLEENDKVITKIIEQVRALKMPCGCDECEPRNEGIDASIEILERHK